MIKQLIHRSSAQHTRIHRLSKEVGWIVAGQITALLGMLVLVRLLTEHLNPAEYGELALGLTIAGLVNQVIMGGFANGISRFYSIATEKDNLYGYLHASRRLLSYATLGVVAVALLLIAGLFITGHSQWLGLTIAVLIFSIFSGYNSALNGVQNAARQRAIVALHGGLDAWLKIGLVVGMMLWCGGGSTVVVIGYTLSAIIVTTSQLFFLKRLMNRQSISQEDGGHENWGWQIWQFSWPFSAWGIFTWAQQASDRWALEKFATTYEVGQYAVVFQLGYTPISMLTGFMITLIGPILYQQAGAAKNHLRNKSVHKIAWRITQVSLVISIVAFVFTWFLHRWIFQWLVAESFRDISHLLPWVVLAGGLFSAGQMLSLKLMSEIRSGSLLRIKVSTALIGIAANILGARWYGINGVTAALVLFSSMYLTWMLFIASHLPTNRNQSTNKALS